MIAWIDGFEECTVLWDIGANIGIFSLYAGLRRRTSVLAFEPSAANFHVLSRNIQLNELSERVTPYCLALSGRTQLGVLNMQSAAMGAAMTQFGQAGEPSRYWNGQIRPSVHGMVGFSIDDFIARFDPPFPNYLKMDVDGFELPILEGARAALRDPRLKSMMIELNITNAVEYQRALALLEAAGFRLSSRGDVQGQQDEKAANHLFERAPRQ
jgi:FkbM family methyltransferase